MIEHCFEFRGSLRYRKVKIHKVHFLNADWKHHATDQQSQNQAILIVPPQDSHSGTHAASCCLLSCNLAYVPSKTLKYKKDTKHAYRPSKYPLSSR